MDLSTIIKQAELSKQAVMEINQQNRIFEQILNDVVKGAPKEDQAKVDEIRLLSLKAINLAKQGKNDEAQKLIKDFQNGR